MTKTKSTKRALLMSALALLLCVSMLVGSTFAWFTDSVTSGNNKIVAGNLDVELEYATAPDGTYTSVEGKGDLFVAPEGETKGLWEPGHTEVAYLRVRNAGTLTLQYNLSVSPFSEVVGENADGDPIKLSEILKFFASEPGETAPAAFTRESARTAAAASSVSLNEYLKSNITLAPGASHYVAVAVYMPETVGNEANYRGDKVPQIEFALTLRATQYTAENDSFGLDYDEESPFPLGKEIDTAVVYTQAVDGLDFAAEVKIPSEAPEGEYELSVPKDQIVITNNNGETSLAFEMDLLRTVNGSTETVTGSGIAWPVTVQLPHPFVEIKQVLHNGKEVEGVTLNKTQNTISFTTTGFSPFEIKYVDYTDPSAPLNYKVVDAENNKYTITEGVFVGINPVEYDESLEDNGSEYIAISYEMNGKTHYLVEKRAGTVVVAHSATSNYTPVNKNYDVFYVNEDVNRKQFHKVFSDEAKAGDTVYILPGTYETETTLTVSKDMNIIGLGDKNEIKIKKISCHSDDTNKPENRHLFNCTNTSETYIHVTIRNLSLDASDPNSYVGKIFKNYDDNAAVQSISRSKVKCYDLVIIKGKSGSTGNFPFYVNANNLACETYLYAENCLVKNETKTTYSTNEIVDTHQSAKYTQYFYYYNLTFAGTQSTIVDPVPTGTKGERDIQNVSMAADDWTWD